MKIKCPACDFENKENAKFCSNCNEPLVDSKISINKENSYIKKEIANNNTENTSIKSMVKKERLWMNWKQKIILSVFIPVLLFSITYTIAYYVSVEERVIQSAHTTPTMSAWELFAHVEAELEAKKAGNPYWQSSEPLYTYHPAVIRKDYNPYNWQKTWYVWLLFLAFCCFFEYKLFEDKEIISNKKNKELR